MEVSILNGYKIKDKKAIRFYDTVDDMINDDTLKEGMHVKTKGYYEVGDGGHGEYVITNNDNNLIFKIQLSNNLYAELLDKNTVVIDSLGASQLEDCSSLLQALFDFPVNKILTAGKEYNVLNDITISKEIIFDGNNCKLNLDEATIFINIEGDQASSHYDYFGEIKNFHFIGNSNNPIIQVTRGYKSHIYNCEFKGFTGSGLVHIGGYENVYDLLRFDGVGVNSIGLDIRGNDIIVKNIYGKDCHTFIKCTGGGNMFNNLHAWLLDVNLFNGSIFFDNQTSQINKLDTVYFDTYETCVNCPLYGAITISNSLVLNTSQAITPEHSYIFNLHGNPYNGQRIYVNNMTCYLGTTWTSTFKVNSETNNQINFDGLIIPGYEIQDTIIVDNPLTVGDSCENVSLSCFEEKPGITHIQGIVKASFDNTNTCQLWKLNSYTKPVENYEGLCFYTSNRYLNNSQPAFLTINATNGSGTIILPSAYTGDYYVFVDVIYRRKINY